MQLLLGHWPMDKPVRLLSVTAANLLPENQSCEQLSLFDAAEVSKSATASISSTRRLTHCGRNSVINPLCSRIR